MLGFDFFVKVVLISSSGALAPGPLSASTLAVGSRSGWKAGIMVSFGHMLVEFPLILLIGIGFIEFLKNRMFIITIGFLGSMFILIFGFLMMKEGLKGSQNTLMQENTRAPLIIGVLLTGLNPYFLLWWFMVGGILIVEAVLELGILGLLIMFTYHIWVDYVWLIFLAELSRRGKNVLKSKGYKVFLVTIGAILIIFGLQLLLPIIFLMF